MQSTGAAFFFGMCQPAVRDKSRESCCMHSQQRRFYRVGKQDYVTRKGEIVQIQFDHFCPPIVKHKLWTVWHALRLASVKLSPTVNFKDEASTRTRGFFGVGVYT